MKTIYKVYVPIDSQEQADRMKQTCIHYGLPYWDDDEILTYEKGEKCIFCCDLSGEFWLVQAPNNILKFSSTKTQVTESEFLELVKMLNKC